MKRKHFSIPFFLGLFFLFIQVAWVYAQEDQYEKIKSIKIAYMTEQLGLTPAEAEIFWPVYNDFENRRNKIRDDRKKVMDNFIDNGESMSEQEVSKLLGELNGFNKADYDLMIEYNNKLKEILSPRKVMKLHLAEIQFRHHLIEKLREQRRGGRPGN